jgi:hypothetical protein
MNTKKEITQCPDCYSESIAVVLGMNRLNLYECRDCGWESDLFEPETRPVTGIVGITPHGHVGWSYYIFDKYGQPYMSSRCYGTDREAALQDLMENLNRLKQPRDKDIGCPFKGVLYFIPPRIEIQGEIFT